MAEKRFKVALSFPGQKRTFIQQVADLLAHEFGRPQILYDKYHAAEFARPNLGMSLPKLYREESELVVYFVCKDYVENDWTQLEWRAIMDMIKHKQYDALMHFKFDLTEMDGIFSIDGYIEINGQTPQQICDLILERIRRNETALLKANSIDSAGGMEILRKMEQGLAALVSQQQATPSAELQQQIQTLTQEKEELRQLLLQKEDVIAQQETTRKELEQSLAAEQGKEELKKQALKAVEEKNYNKAKELVKEASKERIEKVAEDFHQLGTICELNLEFAEALKYYELAAKIPPHHTEYLRKAAKLCRTFGQIEPSIQYLEQALAIDLQNQGAESNDVAADYNNLALRWKDKGDLDKAIEYLEKALVIGLKLFGEENAILAPIYNNLGSAWHDKGDPDIAIEFSEKALRIDLKIHGEQNTYIIVDYNNLGMAWRDKGDLDKAIEYGQKSYAIFLKLYGADNPSTKRVKANLDGFLREKGGIV